MNVTADLADQFARDHPREAALVLEGLRHDQAAELLSEIEQETAAEILGAMSVPMGARLLPLIDRDRISSILQHLSAPVSANLLRHAPSDFRETVLRGMPQSVANSIRGQLRYPSHTVGAMMNPHVTSFAADTIIADAIASIRSEHDTRQYIYATGDEHALAGVITVGELIAADPAAPLSAVMTPQVVRLRHDDPLEMVAKHDAWWKWRELPVVEKGVLIGVFDYESIRPLSDMKRAESDLAISLPMSLAELLWLGLIGITDGLTRVVTRSGDSDAR